MKKVLALAIGGWPITDPATSGAMLSLIRESDRAAAVLGAILVEDQLEARLRKELRPDAFKKLFGVGRPLQFAGARNDLAFSMRIYGKPFHQELETISSIRNKFAHYHSHKGQPIRDFKSAIIKSLCDDELKLLEPFVRAKVEHHEKYKIGEPPSWMKEDPLAGIKDPRRKYLDTCALCASALSGYMDARVLKVVWADTFPSPDMPVP